MVRAINQEVRIPGLADTGVRLFIKREDLLFPECSGNKFRKLKYNLEAVRQAGLGKILTFGGAYSNHIQATAAAGQRAGLQTIGIIRGEELAFRPLNPTLEDARAAGMTLHFVSREEYRLREDPKVLARYQEHFGPAYILPEGGTNELAVKGCEEILGPEDRDFDLVCCSVGTGGTLAGLARSAAPGQWVRGYAALASEGLNASVRRWCGRSNWEITHLYHLGGYAAVRAELIDFMNRFHGETGIPLDPVYTGKMIYGIVEDVAKGNIPPGSRVLAIHTGGLQGIRGMNRQLKKKNLPLLHL